MRVVASFVFLKVAFGGEPAAWTSSCKDPKWAGCHGLAGLCCPNADGEMLACCQKTPVPAPTPRPSWGQLTTLSKAGFPEREVAGRKACGSMEVKKSFRNPAYLLPLVFRGFREHSCPERGYRRYEREEPGSLKTFPWSKQKQTFSVWSHEVSWADTGLCVLEHCSQPLKSVAKDNISSGVLASLSSTVPCLSGTWACLGDEKCSAAARCLWPTVRTCGNEALELLRERSSRAEIACIWECEGKPGCVLKKCGRTAATCLFDKQCIKRIMCFPDAMLKCSVPGLKCLLEKSSACRQNLKCFASAATDVSQSVEHYMTDANLLAVTSCASAHCKHPVGPVLPHDSTISGASASLNAAELHASGASEAEAMDKVAEVFVPQANLAQGTSALECVRTQCPTEWQRWHEHDADLIATSTCPARVMQECGHGLWHCLFTEGQCYDDVQCLLQGLLGPETGKGGWLGAVVDQLTQPKARAFDAKVYKCLSGCHSRRSPLARTICYLGSCSHEVVACLHDATCKEALVGFPEMLNTCGKHFVSNYRQSWQAHFAGECMLKLADECANDLVEMLRDTNTTDVIKCGHERCSKPSSTIVV